LLVVDKKQIQHFAMIRLGLCQQINPKTQQMAVRQASYLLSVRNESLFVGGRLTY
jgi:hypothetical protein